MFQNHNQENSGTNSLVKVRHKFTYLLWWINDIVLKKMHNYIQTFILVLYAFLDFLDNYKFNQFSLPDSFTCMGKKWRRAAAMGSMFVSFFVVGNTSPSSPFFREWAQFFFTVGAGEEQQTQGPPWLSTALGTPLL